MSHSTRAARALAHLPERDPALALLALWCAHRDGAETQSAAETITYGPGFDRLTLAEQIGTVGHHVLHVALRHTARRDSLQAICGAGFDPALFGLVADALVNEVLLLAEHGLPRPAVTVTGLLQASGLPAQTAPAAVAAWDVERLYHALMARPGAARAARDYGAELGWQPDLAPGQTSDNRPADDPATWQERMARALQAGQRAGLGLGRIDAPLAEIAPPRVAWQTELRRLLARAVEVRPQVTWRRPSGRWLAAEAQARATRRPVPVFEPQTSRLTYRPRVVVGLDASASVDRDRLRVFAGEVTGIGRRSGAELHLLVFDTDLHVDRVLAPDRLLDQMRSLALPRGGGTDFRPVLARAADLRPSVCVMLTDLDGPVGAAPGFPVIWAVPGAAPAAPFGKVIELG